MKDLELHIHPKSTGLHGEEVYLNPEGTQLALPVSGVDELSKELRLSDAEIAAIFHLQRLRAVVESGHHKWIGQDGKEYLIPGDYVTFGPMRREADICLKLSAFCSTPHYDEED